MNYYNLLRTCDSFAISTTLFDRRFVFVGCQKAVFESWTDFGLLNRFGMVACSINGKKGTRVTMWRVVAWWSKSRDLEV